MYFHHGIFSEQKKLLGIFAVFDGIAMQSLIQDKKFANESAAMGMGGEIDENFYLAKNSNSG